MLGRRSLGLVSLVFALLAVIPTATGSRHRRRHVGGLLVDRVRAAHADADGRQGRGLVHARLRPRRRNRQRERLHGPLGRGADARGPRDAGAVIFTLQSGGKSFTGRWSYDGDPATFFTTWNGKCTAGSCLQNGVAAVATTFLHLQVIGSDAVVNPSPAGTIYNPDCPNNVCIFRYPVGTTVTLDAGRGAVRGLAPALLELAHPVRGQVALHDHDGWRESRQGRLLTAADEPRLEPRRPHRGLRAGLWHSLRPRPVRDHREGGCSRRSGLSPPGLARHLRRGKTKYCNVTMRDNRSAYANFVRRRDRHRPAADHALRPVPRLGAGVGGRCPARRGCVRAGLRADRLRARPTDRAHGDSGR